MMELLSILALIQLSSCINISPVPNFRFNLPSKNAEISKTRSTYFGYSVNLRRNSIMIGSPRANSTVSAQKTINEPGVVFKCNFDQTCNDYNFDVRGNEEKYEKFDKRKKDLQMLGAVVSGGSSETHPLIVCAPNFRAVALNKTGHEEDHFMNGICFFVDQTNSSKATRVLQISPFNKRDQQFEKKGEKIFLYHDGMSGFSADISENNEIVLGCPGVLFFSGSIARYQPKNPEPNILYARQNDRTAKDNYFGYSVSSGMFLGKKKGTISYVASVPRKTMRLQDKIPAHNGTVVIFNMNTKVSRQIQTVEVVSGTQLGEYFGYSLLTEDFNNDGFADLAVSAPLYSKDRDSESGAVYIFINSGSEKKVLANFLDFNSFNIFNNNFR